MTKFITVANIKGGVSKTTVVANLSQALANRGRNILNVDVDPQGSLTLHFGHSMAILQEQQKTIYYAVVKDKPMGDIIIPGNPALIPSSLILTKSDRELIANMRFSD